MYGAETTSLRYIPLPLAIKNKPPGTGLGNCFQ
nr:MAG TPA: hypothetical protein [Caudoviricetes sp.]